MDENVISMPRCEYQINNDSCVISGSFDQESAQNLADLINIGQMPFTLEQVELRSVGPQLGMDALRTSMVAGAIGIALIAIFMMVVYRVPGIVSCIGLAFYIAVEAVIFGLVHVNLSLAGIAGILLSIGMAVDANVVIFERIKEELRAGKSVKASIESGFKRAFAAILDSNVTTLIAAVVLGFMGTGTIVGFAITLGIGVVVSMFTALTVTHLLLNAMADFGIRSPKAYGA
jgi:protein-export membrane protein SecD